jgi:AraC-like DNA-binding protein/mannose-6-phosphate isomerase-like protein (cupin superfamily)
MFKNYHIGHFIGEPQREVPFAITRFETMQEPDVDDLHKHTFYEVLWIEKGKTKQFIDYQEYEIADNTMFFISQGQLHSFEAWQGVEGACIMFTEDFFLLNQNSKDLLFELSFLDNLYANPFLDLSEQNIAELKPTIQLLIEEKERKDCSNTILQSLLHILLTKIQRCIDEKRANVSSKKYLVLFKKFKKLLDENFEKQLSVSDYAEKLSVTQHHLNLVAKEITGKTATEVIRARTILEAKRLLTFTDFTVTEIAFRLGFEENSYFSRVFKKETNISPNEFKNQMSEKYHIV